MSRRWSCLLAVALEFGVGKCQELFTRDFSIIILTYVHNHLIYVSVARWLSIIEAEDVLDLHGSDVAFLLGDHFKNGLTPLGGEECFEVHRCHQEFRKLYQSTVGQIYSREYGINFSIGDSCCAVFLESVQHFLFWKLSISILVNCFKYPGWQLNFIHSEELGDYEAVRNFFQWLICLEASHVGQGMFDALVLNLRRCKFCKPGMFQSCSSTWSISMFKRE